MLITFPTKQNLPTVLRKPTEITHRLTHRCATRGLLKTAKFKMKTGGIGTLVDMPPQFLDSSLAIGDDRPTEMTQQPVRA